jgi:hypothetical protein
LQFLHLLPLLLLGWSTASGPAWAADVPIVCATLTEADAVKLLGGPLGAVSRSEGRPTAESGNDYQTSCGYFPKGYNLRKADAPPERGILVTFHAMRDNADAKRYYEGILDLHKDMAKAPGGPRVTPVSGMGDAAYLKPIIIPNSTSKIVTLTFLKGNLTVDVQVWKNAAPVDDIARAAAKQVLAKLP